MKQVSYFLIFILSMLINRVTSLMGRLHYKCRGAVYPRSNIERYPVPDDKVPWNVNYNDYSPPKYTSPTLLGKPWADLDIKDPSFHPKWNSIDGNISRVSYTSQYKIVDNVPQNPSGRTGVRGRGLLGRWGPNHAADCIVTRWKRDSNGKIIYNKLKKGILQFVSVKRRDNGEWALPGGMVDPGENVTQAAMREFQEEAINSLEMTPEQREEIVKKFAKFFSAGELVYKGYVDDPRNTDNAWMETSAFNYHDDIGTTVNVFKLTAGDDAADSAWLDLESALKMYASHSQLIRLCAELRNASW